MTEKIAIPYVDIRGRTPLDLLKTYQSSAHALVVAATNTFGGLSRAASVAALPLGDRISRTWLERGNNPYLSEIRAMAELLGRSGVYLLNVCFEWGCTGGVWQGEDGAVMRRVLDWPFPALGEYIVVAHQSGEAGDFLNVTWPGMSGVYQASAPGRFAAAINQAPMRSHGFGIAGDWLAQRVATARTAALPPAHLLRRVFESASDYGTAKRMLSETPLAVPAIFILAGLDQGCVIERTESDHVVREMESGRVCVANHFVGREQGWRARPIDSAGRLACALASDGAAEDFAWFAPPIANVNSRLVMSAVPRSGALAVMGTEGARPVTDMFRDA